MIHFILRQHLIHNNNNKMLNLNLTFVHEALDDSATSNSSVANVESQSQSSNVAEEASVSGDGDGDTVHCFNFDILNTDDRTTQSEFVTRTLFPMSHQVNNNSLSLFPNSIEVKLKSVHVQPHKPAVQQNQVVRKSRRGPRSRSSQYRGVTFYRRTGRWESHIWDCGKQVYLGGFDTAHAAARAYDRAAIKFRGVDADINFNISDYEEDMNQIKNLSKEDFVHLLRRHSSGFSRGRSKYRGVTLNNCGMWEAPMGQFLGKKAPYDKAATKLNTYEGENVASHCGNSHNLDLNLRISTPSCYGNGPTRNDKMEQQAGNASATTLNGLPVLSEHGQSWTNMYPQIIGGSSQGPSNWAWQPYQGQSQSQTPTALFTAASSGFPAPATQNYLNYN